MDFWTLRAHRKYNSLITNQHFAGTRLSVSGFRFNCEYTAKLGTRILEMQLFIKRFLNCNRQLRFKHYKRQQTTTRLRRPHTTSSVNINEYYQSKVSHSRAYTLRVISTLYTLYSQVRFECRNDTNLLLLHRHANTLMSVCLN